MAKQIFLSYSSKDQAKADIICEALERAGMSCWIAPRDLTAGMQWGAGIVTAIEESKAVVVVFSAAANDSAQVAREMELAVANRLPLIPIRVADDMPTNDMKYFLGVSHWFNAYAEPLDSYLPDILIAVRSTLRAQSSPWATFRRRLPRSREAQMALGALGALIIAGLTGLVLRPANPLGPMGPPITGRWEGQLPNGQGGKTNCVLDVQKTSQIAFSAECPLPLAGARASLTASPDGIWAPDQYRPGDSGTLLFQGGSIHGFAMAYRRSFFGGLVTRDAKFGEVRWRGVSQSTALVDHSPKVLPAKADWPLQGVPGMGRKAQGYVRLKWKPDAELTSIDIKLLKPNEGGSSNLQTPVGGVYITFGFYSPATQEGMSFTPGSSSGDMYPMGVVDRHGDRFLPSDFLDLPQAVALLAANGMRAKQIYEAQIEDWGTDTTYGRAHLSGVAWMIDSQLDERFVVRAAK